MGGWNEEGRFSLPTPVGELVNNLVYDTDHNNAFTKSESIVHHC